MWVWGKCWCVCECGCEVSVGNVCAVRLWVWLGVGVGCLTVSGRQLKVRLNMSANFGVLQRVPKLQRVPRLLLDNFLLDLQRVPKLDWPQLSDFKISAKQFSRWQRCRGC